MSIKRKLWSKAPDGQPIYTTGESVPVAGTPMDFLIAKTIGKDLRKDFPALNYGKGYDNCWVIDGHQK